MKTEGTTESGTLLWQAMLRIPSVRQRLDSVLGIDCEQALDRHELEDKQLTQFLVSGEELERFLCDRGVPLDQRRRAAERFRSGDWLRTMLPHGRQVEIVRDLAADLPRASAGASTNRMAEGDAEDRRRLQRAQWATVATTPPAERIFSSQCQAQQWAHVLDGLEIQHETENLGCDGWLVRAFGCRVCFAFHKRMCQYKREGQGCTYCGQSNDDR